MSQLGLYREIYTLELRRRMAYRSEFWFSFLGVLLANLAVAYYLWRAIFEAQGASVIEGFTLPGIILYYLLVPLVEGITRSHEPGFLSYEVYEGTLTRYLVYPLSFFPYQFAITLAGATIAVVQMLLVLGVYSLVTDFPAEMTVTWASLAVGLGTAVAAGVLNFVMVSMVEMTAFWAENIWSLNVMLMFVTRILGGAMLPLALFPETMQRILAATPFPYLVSFPIQAMAGKLDGATWSRGIFIMLAWAVAFMLVNRLVWRRGNLRYTGVGI